MADSNILQPISPDFNVYLRENASVFFNSTTPAPLAGQVNVTFQFDQFGHVSACTSGGGGSSLSLETNGTANGSQALLNLAAGTGITLTDNGTGTVTVTGAASSGGSGTIQLSNGAGGFTNAFATMNTGTGDVNFTANLDAQNIDATNVTVGGTGTTAEYAFAIAGVNSGGFGAWGTGNGAGLPGVIGLFNGTASNFVWNTNTTNDMFFGTPVSGGNVAAGVGSTASIDHLGNATFATLALTAPVIAGSATAGAAAALPATPLGYLEIASTGGTIVKLPFYAV